MYSLQIQESDERFFLFIYELFLCFYDKIIQIIKYVKKLGKDDPRRIYHSFKVGLALTLVSMLYYNNKLYKGSEENTIWAILTVILVLEFSVGATLGKGLNRMIATFIGGTLGFGAHILADLCGNIWEPILVAIFVFITGTIATLTRFVPIIKARYDYGVLVFVLTYCMVLISGYRDDEVLVTAVERLSTIMIGCCISMIISVFVFPIWIGEDLHNLIVANIEKLGLFLEGFGNEYFALSTSELHSDKSFLKEYKKVLTSKNNEEFMANSAKWEPSHGKFKFFHPWKQYLKIGQLTRECAYKIEALDTILQSDIKSDVGIRKKLEELCIQMSRESGKALKEVASCTKQMKRSTVAAYHILNSEAAIENIKKLLSTNRCEEAYLIDITSIVAIVSILIDIVENIKKVIEAINELASMVHFKPIDSEQPNLSQGENVEPMSSNANNTSEIICIRE